MAHMMSCDLFSLFEDAIVHRVRLPSSRDTDLSSSSRYIRRPPTPPQRPATPPLHLSPSPLREAMLTSHQSVPPSPLSSDLLDCKITGDV